MGGRIVEQWVDALLAADLLAPGFSLVTISYRGNPLNAAVYRDGLIGLAKADLEFHTRALHELLQARVGGRAVAVEGPAVVTEASGGIPGVPYYMAQLLDVMGERFEDPLASMLRMFSSKLPLGTGAAELDEHGLLRMDDRELTAARLLLCRALQTVVANGLDVLLLIAGPNGEVQERMTPGFKAAVLR